MTGILGRKQLNVRFAQGGTNITLRIGSTASIILNFQIPLGEEQMQRDRDAVLTEIYREGSGVDSQSLHRA